jgi:DNA-binding NarL/FixJ family response regulator
MALDEAAVTRLVALTAINLVAGRKQQEQIVLLTKAGYEPREIAELLGTTSNTVSVALSNLRKRGHLKLPGPDGRDGHDTRD